MRARMALRYAGIRCELREVVLRNKPPEMLAASPKGTVPVLVAPRGGGTNEVIDESLDVMLWALAQHDPDGWLDVDAAQANHLIVANDDDFKIWLDRYKYPDRHDGSDRARDEARDEARAECERFLSALEQRLHAHPFLMGDAVSFVDVAIFPFIRQCAFVDRDWFDASPFGRLHQWLSYFLEADLFAAVMHKYSAWQSGNDKVMF